jgi:hypothetical protein
MLNDPAIWLFLLDGFFTLEKRPQPDLDLGAISAPLLDHSLQPEDPRGSLFASPIR